MVNPDNTVYLRHILDACKRAGRFVSGISYEEFVAVQEDLPELEKIIGEILSR